MKCLINRLVTALSPIPLIIGIVGLTSPGVAQTRPGGNIMTVCNPMNLDYRFTLEGPSRREAADPTAITFKNEYYLFASRSGGYWHSKDLSHWDLIKTDDLPLEDYAPTAVTVGDTVYFMASTTKPGGKIYKSADPKSGKWTVANSDFPFALTDPDLFLDDDGRLYLYYGCSNVQPIYVVELDRKTLMPMGKSTGLFAGNPKTYGWERFGDYNERPEKPWLEGAWMTKYKGTYYLQYASPGTEFKSYSDGLYTSDKPLGPFKLAANNPFSARPEGFIAGAGHSSTFQDRYGNFWRISTMSISVKHRWERRLGLFPAFFGPDGRSYTNTAFGDFPFIIPNNKITSLAELFPDWMLLSYGKPVQVSSELPNHPARQGVDEDIRTYWSAATGGPTEWMQIDLQQPCQINAVQLNFAEEGATLLGRSADIAYRYKLAYSDDNRTWKSLADKSANRQDAPHDYLAFAAPVRARYLRVTNGHTPSGQFALSDFRVFGKSPDKLPAPVTNLSVVRDKADPCIVTLTWPKSEGSVGYTIRYGTAPNQLQHTYQVFGVNSLVIRSLNRDESYYFTVDSFNGRGITAGAKPLRIP
ncbi:family 43 glycosylhydrolase [Spirosoma oryzae]|nr:family 43 glycosylhydrolase [Spirosoma oryzae]